MPAPPAMRRVLQGACLPNHPAAIHHYPLLSGRRLAGPPRSRVAGTLAQTPRLRVTRYRAGSTLMGMARGRRRGSVVADVVSARYPMGILAANVYACRAILRDGRPFLCRLPPFAGTPSRGRFWAPCAPAWGSPHAASSTEGTPHMAEMIRLCPAERREVLGQHVSRLRRAGVTPANLYGRGHDSLALQLRTHCTSSVCWNNIIRPIA